MSQQLSNAGMAFPIPADFDLDGWMKKPDDLAPPQDMDLKTRNEDNSLAESLNRTSLRQTRLYMSTTDKTGLDVGQKLMPFWLYSTGDIQAMVKSVRVCKVAGPLPLYLTMMVEAARFNRLEAEEREKHDREKERVDREKARAEKEKEKSTAVKGSMIMTAPVVRTPALSTPVVIPDIYLVSILHRLFPPINWFTDDHIQFAEQHGHQIASKPIRPIAATPESALPEKVVVFDMAKMTVMWGDDETHACLSPLNWQQATLNKLAALVLLCPAPAGSVELYTT